MQPARATTPPGHQTRPPEETGNLTPIETLFNRERTLGTLYGGRWTWTETLPGGERRTTNMYGNRDGTFSLTRPARRARLPAPPRPGDRVITRLSAAVQYRAESAQAHRTVRYAVAGQDGIQETVTAPFTVTVLRLVALALHDRLLRHQLSAMQATCASASRRVHVTASAELGALHLKEDRFMLRGFQTVRRFALPFQLLPEVIDAASPVPPVPPDVQATHRSVGAILRDLCERPRPERLTVTLYLPSGSVLTLQHGHLLHHPEVERDRAAQQDVIQARDARTAELHGTDGTVQLSMPHAGHTELHPELALLLLAFMQDAASGSTLEWIQGDTLTLTVRREGPDQLKFLLRARTQVWTPGLLSCRQALPVLYRAARLYLNGPLERRGR